MADKSNIKPSMMWSSKPVKMKLFGAWEIDKTPPDCIPRLCSLNINRLTLVQTLRYDVTSIIVAVKMQNSKRILRSNEINIQAHNENLLSLDIELDLSFTLQYPHFLKRNCNYLQIILQRRKKYKNKAILGFKTLACGLIDMAEVLQKSTISEKTLDLLGHIKELGKNETLARITISSLKSQPIDQDSSYRRGKVSIDRPDVYSDEDDFTSAEDASDSETIEEGNVRDRFRRKINDRKSRKQFSNDDKFRTVVPSNVQQRNLKQKFISLLKKFRLPDSEAYDSEEKFQEALEKELMSSTQEPPDIDEFFDDEEIDDLDDLSDSGQEFDDVSISSTPKPSLRPFFSSCTLVGQDKFEEEEEFAASQNKKLDNDSQENSGTEQTPDTSDTSLKHGNTNNDELLKKLNADKEPRRTKLFPKEKYSPKEKKSIGTSLSLKDDSSPKEFVLDQLNKVFLPEEPNIPNEIIFVNLTECSHTQQLIQHFERSHHIIATNSIADVKFAFNFLCNKIQKYCNTNPKTSFPIKIVLIGSDSYVNLFLRFYVDSLSSKTPDWQNYLRFYLIPPNHASTHSSLLHYLASIDPAYSSCFLSSNSSKDIELSGRCDNISSDHNACVHNFYSKVITFLNTAQAVLQVPIAEAMVTYKDKNVDEESNQVFIPFICDAKIGLVDSIYGNHSMEEETVGCSSSPPGYSASTQPESKSVTSPKEVHPSTPPNSPSISTNQGPFLQTSAKEHKEPGTSQPSNEVIDLQIDYWTTQPKLADVSNKKNDNCKFTLKNSFRNLQISRLPSLGEANSSSLTLSYMTKEKKQKIMRLGKKKDKEPETKYQVIEGICRLVCSYKTTQSPIKVNVMSWCEEFGKDKVVFVTKEDCSKPPKLELPDLPEDYNRGLILPNGEINFNCPCLGGMASGPCGFAFREAFSCFHYSTSEVKGSECVDKFIEMQNCMTKYPTLYKHENSAINEESGAMEQLGNLDDTPQQPTSAISKES